MSMHDAVSLGVLSGFGFGVVVGIIGSVTVYLFSKVW